MSDKLRDAAQAVVDAYENRFGHQEGGRFFGPIDPEIKELRAALAPSASERQQGGRCAGCDIPNGCPEYCRCAPAPAATRAGEATLGPLRPFNRDTFDLPAFTAAFRRAVAARDVQMKEVSKATGVSETTLSRMKGGRAPDAASLAALSAWAGLNPANFCAAQPPQAPPAAPSAEQGEAKPLPFAVFDEFGKGADDRVQDAIEAARLQGMSQANALWEMAKTETTGDRCAPCTKRCDDCPIDWARLTAEPTTPSKAAILDATTKLFPRWREDIQEKFVLQVAHAVLALRPAEMAKAEQAVPVAWRWTNSETGAVGFHRVRGHGNPEFAHLYSWEPVYLATPPATERRPLTRAQIEGIDRAASRQWSEQSGVDPTESEIAIRMAERAHGITAGTTEQAKEHD